MSGMPGRTGGRHRRATRRAQRRGPWPPSGALSLLLAAAGAAAATACGEGHPPLRSAVLVTLDTTRADALGAFGGPAGLTPALDRLARESVCYERAYTVTPLTLPAHASMLTGLVPLRHGVRENGLWSLSAEAETLPERARAAGFQTAAFLAAVVLDRRYGLDQGFELYDAPERPAVQASTHPAERSGDEVVGRAIEWLRARDPERPFFLWVHLFDPHGPWNPDPSLLEAAHGNPYHAEVAAADAAVGRLVEELRAQGLLDEIELAVVADHGEGLGDHGEPSHGAFVYESTLRVPFLLRDPRGRRAGERDRSIVSVVDVFPTLLEAMGLAVPSGVDGRSLRRSPAREQGVYFEAYAGAIAYGWSQMAGWLDEHGKYVHSSKPQFFDLERDPGEREDRIAFLPAEELARYRGAIARLAGKPRLRPADAQATDPALVAELRALGYAAVGAPADELPEPLAPSDRPSPPTRMGEHRRALRAMELANLGRLEEAAAELQALADANPDDFFVLDRLGDALKRLGRHAEAIGPLRRVVEDGPAWSYSTFTLGICLLETGQHEQALAVFRRALLADPALAATVAAMLDTLERRGDEQLAARYRSLLE